VVETDRKQRFIGRLKRLLDMAIAECSLKASLELGRLISVMENRSVPTMELPTLGSRLPNPLTVSMSRSRLFLGGLLSSSEVPDRCSGQSGKEHWSSLKMPQASAVKTAGSLVPSSPTCSAVLDPVLNTVMTSAVQDCGGSRLGDYFLCTVRATRSVERRETSPKSEPKL